MSAAGASQYNVLEISKPGRGIVVDTKGKCLGFDYYESVFSPMVTATMLEYDTGGTVAQRRSGLRGTLKDALPIEGFEEVRFEIVTRYGTLDFTKRPMIITGSPQTIDEPQRQSVLIPMVSKHSIDNSKTVSGRTYPQAKISDVVKKILSDPTTLKIDKSRQFIENTSNEDKVSMNHDAPLDAIVKLCKKSIPENGKDPGYFFFETKSGFHFKSISGLIYNGIKKFDEDLDYAYHHIYSYPSTGERDLKRNERNNFTVLNPPDVKRDQNILSSLRKGVYNVRICTLNPITHQYTEKVVNLLSDVNLGGKHEIPPEVHRHYHKTYSYILNPGANANGVSQEILNSPAVYEPKAIMRYNLLQAQLVTITVPCNMKLEAGDVIRLDLINITQDDKLLEIYNLHRSGYYLIMNLSHHFDPNKSYTILTLARDTYGYYVSKK